MVVCSHNELENLKKLISCLFHQDYPTYEVIIIDDRSLDGTSQWLKDQQSQYPNLKVVNITQLHQGINPKKYALLKGIEAANYDLLLLTDADCYPVSSKWIWHMVGAYQTHTQIVLGYSGYETKPGLLNQLIQYETLLTAVQYLSRALAGKSYMGVGRNLSYRRKYFNEVKGLSKVLSVTGGDDDLFVNQHATAENTEVCLDRDSFVLSKPKLTWSSYFKQKKRHLAVGKRYKWQDKWVLGIFSTSHIIFWSSLVSLLTTSTLIHWVAAGFVIRQFAISWVLGKSSKKLGTHLSNLLVPFLDFLYSVFYLISGLTALLSKRINWH